MIANENNGAAVAINETSKAGVNRYPGRFVKGDPRINRKGRIRTFSEFRKIAQEIASRAVVTKDGRTIKKGEALLEEWSNSKEPQLQKAFAEYAFGKVPDKLEASGPEGAPLRPMVIQVITPAAALVIDRECPSEIARSESVGLKGLTMKVNSANEAGAEDQPDL